MNRKRKRNLKSNREFFPDQALQPADPQRYEIPADQLRWRCPREWIPASRSDEIEPTDEIIGQDRALRAIETGLRIKSYGFNIYVSGLTGTGKMTTIQKLLEQIQEDGPVPDDICYVYNFDDPNEPLPLYLKAGDGRAFVRDMENLVERLRQIVPELEENEQFKEERKILLERYRRKSLEPIQQLQKEAEKRGLALIQIEMGGIPRPELFPILDGKPVPWEQLQEKVESGEFPREQMEALQQKREELLETLHGILRQSQSAQTELNDSLRVLKKKYLHPILTHWKTELQQRYERQEVRTYLDKVFQHIEEHLEDFSARGENELESGDPYLCYRVNLLVDNSQTRRPPIVIETAPTYTNLFGTIEASPDPRGRWNSSFMQIRGGSILRANGGYLVINLVDALMDSRVWPALKRVLKNSEIIIQPDHTTPWVMLPSIKPRPIRVQLKVIAIGDRYTYDLLYEMEDEFRKIFKIRADFDTEMPNGRDAVQKYIRFISKICRNEQLLPVDREGMAAIVEYGVRLAGRNNKLSTRFSDIADIIREAHYWARQENAGLITESHINRAIQARQERLSLSEEKLRQAILDDVLLIDTSGNRIGQVNGLSIYDMGDYSFGKPSKITAEVALGRAGIINIEREAELSGKIYNKGVLIISGYLNGKYAQELPLTIHASICFEQSYTGVDGDSASAAEILALLSSIARIPLRQDLAITGSVNQKGEIQPIGGVNEKIEGFYDICKARGFTGTQGVVIPRKNVPDLMLKPEVIESVRRGEFHIYAIDTIDEGIEIMTGMVAGKRDRHGRYPEHSVHYRVQKRLREMAEKMKEFEM